MIEGFSTEKVTANFCNEQNLTHRESEISLLEQLRQAEHNRQAGAPIYSLDEMEKELAMIYEKKTACLREDSAGTCSP